MQKLFEYVMQALEESGYSTMSALERWNTFYRSMILAAPSGTHKLLIGKYEISYKHV